MNRLTPEDTETARHILEGEDALSEAEQAFVLYVFTLLMEENARLRSAYTKLHTETRRR